MKGSLNNLYSAIDISKQSFHQRMNRKLREQAYAHQLLYLIYELRKDHPTMGCRDMYYCLQPEFLGRDKFEWFCKEHGLSSEKPVNYSRTTDSSGVIRFVDLTIHLELKGLNQLWVSDITYYEIQRKFYYLTFVMDAFSRRILGQNVSLRLFTGQTTLPALKMAVEVRKGMNIEGTIFHSDGGGQYYDEEFLNETNRLGLRNSMCEYPWDNGKAERINGIIKNNYLKHRSINNFEELKKEVDRSVKLYNEQKPHIGLNRLSPINFEKGYICSGRTSDGEKSTTEYESHRRRPRNGPAGCRKTSSGSNITPEYVKYKRLTLS